MELIILINIIVSCLIGGINALFVIFIDFCFNDGNIFDWYYQFIKTKIKPNYPYLAKPLGLCPICMGFWIGVLVFSLFSLLVYPLNIFYFIPFISVSSGILIKKFID